VARSFTTEFKVGLFTLACLGLVGFGYVWFQDGVSSRESVYRVTMAVPSADGLYAGTPVKIAGVDVGSVESIEVEGNQARLVLVVKDTFPIPTDSTARLASSGLLGDRHVALDLGQAESVLPEQGRLQAGPEPGSFDEITRQAEDISEDVKAITKVLREVVEDDRNKDAVEATLENVEAITREVRLLAERNRSDVDAIVDSVRRLTEHLEGMSSDARPKVNEELDKLALATDELQATLEDLESITSKVDEGQGTIGALVNDRETIDALNDTIANANQVIESFSGVHAEVYYLGRYYAGTQPSDPAFSYGNPIAPARGDGPLGFAGANTLGIELHHQEDFWWNFEVNDHPAGVIRNRSYYYPESGETYTEWTRDLNYRFTFQMNKRWRDVAFRLGVKESGGGLGFTGYLLRDRLMINADAFDFAFGSYPALAASGIPNLRLGARAEPIRHLWLEVGAEQVLLGARYGYATGYGGIGFHFSDDDIKLLFATLPLNF
jgi:phospholipid/cholesterol/gamma-HCH transport system substrate-binding protein